MPAVRGLNADHRTGPARRDAGRPGPAPQAHPHLRLPGRESDRSESEGWCSTQNPPILRGPRLNFPIMQDGKVVTNGGCVLCVVAMGDIMKTAQKHAYEIADTIHFDGCQMRHDIGYRAIAHRK